MNNRFRYFNSSPRVIRLAVMICIRYPLSLRQVEERLFERGIDTCHETIRYLRNRFGPVFAAEIRERRVHHRSYPLWRWRLDEVFVRINGETHYRWRAVDHEGELLEVFATPAVMGTAQTGRTHDHNPQRSKSLEFALAPKGPSTRDNANVEVLHSTRGKVRASRHAPGSGPSTRVVLTFM